MKASIVIPCYNEAPNLPLLVPRCLKVAAAGDLEIILVDNGSSDGSMAILDELLKGQEAVRGIRVDVNQGYGYGILAGLRAARGYILGWTHADMQTDVFDVIAGLDLFQQSADPGRLFVKGRRAKRPFGDAIFTFGMSIFETLLLLAPLNDINAQPTMFPREFFATWSEPPSDFSLDLFAYYLARRADLRIARFPVTFGKRAHGVSHWNVNYRAKAKFIARTVTYSLRLRRSLAQKTIAQR